MVNEEPLGCAVFDRHGQHAEGLEAPGKPSGLSPSFFVGVHIEYKHIDESAYEEKTRENKTKQKQEAGLMSPKRCHLQCILHVQACYININKYIYMGGGGGPYTSYPRDTAPQASTPKCFMLTTGTRVALGQHWFSKCNFEGTFSTLPSTHIFEAIHTRRVRMTEVCLTLLPILPNKSQAWYPIPHTNGNIHL